MFGIRNGPVSKYRLSMRNHHLSECRRASVGGVMGEYLVKTWFDYFFKVKYGVRGLKGQPQNIVVQAFCRKAVLSAIIIVISMT